MTGHDPRAAGTDFARTRGLLRDLLGNRAMADLVADRIAAAGLIVRPADEWERVRLPLPDTGPSPVDGSNDAGRLADLWLFWDRGCWDIWHGQHAPTGARPLYVRKENPAAVRPADEYEQVEWHWSDDCCNRPVLDGDWPDDPGARPLYVRKENPAVDTLLAAERASTEEDR